jgi:hypothetical protein
VVSRRSVVFGAAGIAAAVPLVSTLEAIAADGEKGATGPKVPETLAKMRGGLTSGSQVPETEFPLTHLALSWTGGAAAVRLRTSAGWGAWQEARGCAAGSDSESAGSRAMLATPGAVGYEIQIAGGGTATTLDLNTVDGPTRTTATSAGTLPLPSRPMAVNSPPWSPETAQALPGYVSRSAWGADESFRLNPDGSLDAPPEFFPVQTLTVHHTGFDSNNDLIDPAANVRAIYYNQAVTKDWGDIGYQLLIDAVGRVYEGTFSDPDQVPVFGPQPAPDGRPQMVNGAHVGQFNAGNIGVCLIGDFTARQPTAAARQSLALVLAILAAATGLDPQGTTHYVNPFNRNVADIATISGHRDWNTANPLAGPTLCPGDMFHPTLPDLRRDVADLITRLGMR